MSSRSPERAGLSRGRKLFLSLATFVVTLFLCEIVARGFAFSHGRPTGPSSLRTQVLRQASALIDDLPGATPADKLKSRAQSPNQPHPFTAWDTQWNQGLSRELIMGYRAGELQEKYVIVITGGSVSGIFAMERTGGVPEFERLLRADPRFAGVDVVSFNQGRGAWKEPQQLTLMAYLFARGVQPDLVINIDGFNEVALTNQNFSMGVDPMYPSYLQWGPLHEVNKTSQLREFRGRAVDLKLDAARIAKQGTRGLAPYSLLWTEFTLRRLRGLGKEAHRLRNWYAHSGNVKKQHRAIRGIFYPKDTENVVQEGVDLWWRSSLGLDALCRVYGVSYLHVLQPTLWDRGAKAFTNEERRTGEIHVSWRDGVKKGYPLMRERGAELVASGVQFLDATRVFEDNDDTLYYDGCHFGQEGNEILGRFMAEAFLAELPPGPVR